MKDYAIVVIWGESVGEGAKEIQKPTGLYHTIKNKIEGKNPRESKNCIKDMRIRLAD